MTKWYTKLSEFVQETDNFIRLLPSTKFGDKIRDEYKKLKSTVKVTHSTSKYVGVKLESDCNSKTEQDNIHICKNVEETKILEFKAKIDVDKNFCKEDLTTTIDIKLEGTENKTVLNIECQKCQCGDTEVSSPTCSNQGDLICGGCKCR